MRKSFSTEFDYGQKVILKTDPANVRIVTGFMLRKDCKPVIGLASGTEETWHQMDEVSNAFRNFKVRGFK